MHKPDVVEILRKTESFKIPGFEIKVNPKKKNSGEAKEGRQRQWIWIWRSNIEERMRKEAL